MILTRMWQLQPGGRWTHYRNNRDRHPLIPKQLSPMIAWGRSETNCCCERRESLAGVQVPAMTK